MTGMTDAPRDDQATEITFPGGEPGADGPGARPDAGRLDDGGPRDRRARPVLLVIGGADGLPKAAEASLRTLVDAGVVPAVETVGPVVVDGGTAAGIMAIVGEAIAAAHVQVTVLGVAPGGRVTWKDDTRPGISGATDLEPHHSHFILADSDAWGGETPLLFEVVEAIADPSRTVALVAGGGPGHGSRGRLRGPPRHPGHRPRRERRRRRRPGRGRRGSRGEPRPKAVDPDLTAILGDIDLTVVAHDADPALLERSSCDDSNRTRHFGPPLRQYRILARTARRQQRPFKWYQRSILALGLLATILVVLQASLQNAELLAKGSFGDQLLQYGIVLIPIAVGVLVAGAARLRPGGRWVLLRGAAEAIKRETYRYRARTRPVRAGPRRDGPRAR